MRMWMVDPTIMCRSHLLGEHKELHMFVGSILRGTSLNGYVKKGQVEVHSIIARHEELVREFERRGYQHNSPIQEGFKPFVLGQVNLDYNYRDLLGRCLECRSNANGALNPMHP